MFVEKISKNMGKLLIKEVDYSVAKEMIVKNHYSKKWNTSFGKINIGIFKDNKLLGVAVFGNMMNPNSHKKITELGKDSVIELNRLWIDDELGHNAETLLLGACWKIIKKTHPEIKFIQSFADGRLGCGTIYKASNFKYFGYTESLFFRDIKNDEVFHKVPLENTKRPLGFLGKNYLYLDGNLEPFKVKTYRYIYPLYKKHEIKLKEVEYPKYDKGIIPVSYSHSPSLLGRLALMYNEIGDEEYMKKCILEMKKHGLSKEDIQEHVDNQKQNKSFIWFKNEYLPNNKDKLKNNISKYKYS